MALREEGRKERSATQYIVHHNEEKGAIHTRSPHWPGKGTSGECRCNFTAEVPHKVARESLGIWDSRFQETSSSNC